MAEQPEAVESMEEEKLVTMLDVLQEENQLEEDANAVLGATDDKSCTYGQGYIRQALYACNTCNPGGKEPAGVCLGCSFNCHEGHELIELYTKRHFRCDCGNSKFPGKKCTLDPAKASVNHENKYNQNFTAVYCTCARPYPDPEDTSNDEMLQCVICEDWYHSKHLNCKDEIPDENSYEEVVCSGCMKEHNFLWRYGAQYSVNKSVKNESILEESLLDVSGMSVDCKMPAEGDNEPEGACFWADGWRAALCTCDACTKMYESQNISFIIDPTDSVQAYEEAGKLVRPESAYERGMKALASLDHVQQVNAIEEYNNMKDHLMQYLKKFVDNKKVVREEDIKEFFSEMSSNKRPKVSVPPFCR